jgi:MFS transporter, ACS family, hexuronate transporter
MKNYRWRIVAILFFATVINYIDRNVLSFIMIDSDFKHDMLGIDRSIPMTDELNALFKQKMGYVDWAFKTTYALGFLLIGFLIDKVGVKKGLSWGILLWSIAGVLTSAVSGVRSLMGARMLLGLGESSIFPSAVKAISEWFPKKERTFATGLFNAGTNIGVITTAFCVPLIAINFGWKAAFFLTGLLGFIVFIFWKKIYTNPEENPLVSAEELAYIQSDGVEKTYKFRWGSLLRYRQMWALIICKFMADPVWWFYLTWLPSFFNDNTRLDQKLDLKTIGIPFLVIYLVSDFGAIFFGWLSTQFMNRGWSLNKARKTTLFICACCVLPIYFAATTNNLWVAVALIALATAAHQGWSSNVYPIGSDLFPKQMVASVSGIGAMAGSVGGMIMAPLSGYIIAQFGYQPLFIWASLAYLIGWVLLNVVLPDMKPIEYQEV